MDSTLKVPGYSIEKEIGRGGMATVYIALQESLARRVALKIMAPGMMADPTAEERFLKEGKIVARLKHPNIVNVYDIGRADAIYYMIMEYIEGGNLNKRLDQGISVESAISITKQIAKALAYAHNRGFIHRDVKPANILFHEDGTAVLSDFGIAKAVGSQTQLTATGQIIGTPEYMSPEQITAKPLDSRSDLYSLGVLLYEMLTRQKPFKGEDTISTAMSHLMDPIPRLPKRLSDFQPLIDRLLAKEPKKRLDSGERLILALEDLLAKKTFASRFSKDKVASSLGPTVIIPRGKAEDVVTSSIGPTVIIPSSKETAIFRGKRETRNLSWVVILIVLVLSIGAALFYLQWAHRIDPQTRKVIDILLVQADREVADSRLMRSSGGNAYKIYTNVLQLDPKNARALEGLAKIADHYEAQAKVEQQQGRYKEGLALTEQGLKANPLHSGLLELQEQFSRQIKERHR